MLSYTGAQQDKFASQGHIKSFDFLYLAGGAWTVPPRTWPDRTEYRSLLLLGNYLVYRINNGPPLGQKHKIRRYKSQSYLVAQHSRGAGPELLVSRFNGSIPYDRSLLPCKKQIKSYLKSVSDPKIIERGGKMEE